MGYKYNDGKIQYNELNTVNVGFGGAPIGKADNYEYNDDFDTVTSIKNKVINVVEIDWNGMVLGDKTINTTGELLSA